MAYNYAAFYGTLVKPPTVKTTSKTHQKLVTGTIAVDRDYKSPATGQWETDFIDYYAWGHTGDNIRNWLGIGSRCIMSGRMESFDVEDSNGKKNRKTRLNVLRVHFTGKKTDTPGREADKPYEKPQYDYQPLNSRFYADEDLPPFDPSEEDEL